MTRRDLKRKRDSGTLLPGEEELLRDINSSNSDSDCEEPAHKKRCGSSSSASLPSLNSILAAHFAPLQPKAAPKVQPQSKPYEATEVKSAIPIDNFRALVLIAENFYAQEKLIEFSHTDSDESEDVGDKFSVEDTLTNEDEDDDDSNEEYTEPTNVERVSTRRGRKSYHPHHHQHHQHHQQHHSHHQLHSQQYHHSPSPPQQQPSYHFHSQDHFQRSEYWNQPSSQKLLPDIHTISSTRMHSNNLYPTSPILSMNNGNSHNNNNNFGYGSVSCY